MISVVNPLPRHTVGATFLIAAFFGSCNVPGPTAPDESTVTELNPESVVYVDVSIAQLVLEVETATPSIEGNVAPTRVS